MKITQQHRHDIDGQQTHENVHGCQVSVYVCVGKRVEFTLVGVEVGGENCTLQLKPREI